jgi:hypothetical protein
MSRDAIFFMGRNSLDVLFKADPASNSTPAPAKAEHSNISVIIPFIFIITLSPRPVECYLSFFSFIFRYGIATHPSSRLARIRSGEQCSPLRWFSRKGEW